MFETSSGEITQKYLSLSRGFLAYFFRYVADSKVYGVCGFTSKQSQLCLIGRYDNRDDCSARGLFFKCDLQNRRYVSEVSDLSQLEST